jgi:hypothetical protein
MRLLILLLLAAAPASAQVSFFTDRAIQPVSVTGQPQPLYAPIPYAGVRVCGPLPLTQTSPCLPLATITDANGVTLSNSIGGGFGQTTADATGRFTFGCTLGANLQVQTAGASNTPVGNYPITCPGSGVQAGGNNIFSGTNTFTAANTFSNFNGLVWVDGVKYTTIAAAYATISAGQCIVLPPNYTETLTANLTFSTDNTCVLAFGRATITQGAFQVIVSAGLHGFYMASLSPMGPQSNSTQTGQIAFVGYTGTAEAFKVGAAGSDTVNIDLRNVYVKLTSAGAGAIGFAMYRTLISYLEHDSVFTNGNANNQICYLYDAKDGTSIHKMQMQDFCETGVGSATGTIGLRQTGNIQNSGGAGWVKGGDYTLMGAGIAGTVCFDILTGDTWALDNPSCENSNVALHVASTQAVAVTGYVRADSTVTTPVVFDAGSQANKVFVQNNNTPTDNGTNNSIEFPSLNQVNTRFWRIIANSTDYVVQNFGSSINVADFGASNTFFRNPGGGAFSLASNPPLHTQFCNQSNLNCLQFNTNSLTASRSVTWPDAAFTVGQSIASGTATMTTAAIAGGACGTTVTVAATGVATTDAITWSFNASVGINPGELNVTQWPTANNVNFQYCNETGASVTPTAATLNWRVVR